MIPLWRDRPSQIFLNTTGETIPAYACMELDYFAESSKSANELPSGSQELQWRVKKPTANAEADPGRVVFNGATPVQANARGSFQTDHFILAAFDDTDGAPAVGGKVGPKNGSWYLTTATETFLFRSYDSGQALYESASKRSIWIDSIGSGGGSQYDFYWYTLTSTFSSGTATADIRNLEDDTAIASGVTIKDKLNHLDGLTSGYRGLCIKLGTSYYAFGPYLTSVRWSSPNLERTRDGGASWQNIDTAESC